MLQAAKVGGYCTYLLPPQAARLQGCQAPRLPSTCLHATSSRHHVQNNNNHNHNHNPSSSSFSSSPFFSSLFSIRGLRTVSVSAFSTIMSIGNQPPSPPYATPPGSFTKDKDTDTVLTPPPTNEKSTSTGLRIIEKIKQLKSRRDGGSGGGEGGARDRRAISVPWATYKLDAEGYRDLQRRIQRDKALAAFVEHKLRYVEGGKGEREGVCVADVIQ